MDSQQDTSSNWHLLLMKKNSTPWKQLLLGLVRISSTLGWTTQISHLLSTEISRSLKAKMWRITLSMWQTKQAYMVKVLRSSKSVMSGLFALISSQVSLVHPRKLDKNRLTLSTKKSSQNSNNFRHSWRKELTFSRNSQSLMCSSMLPLRTSKLSSKISMLHSPRISIQPLQHLRLFPRSKRIMHLTNTLSFRNFIDLIV